MQRASNRLVGHEQATLSGVPAAPVRDSGYGASSRVPVLRALRRGRSVEGAEDEEAGVTRREDQQDADLYLPV